MSLRCTCSFSRPSTADVLSPRPYAHTTNNLGSRSPSIAPVFTHTFSRQCYQMDCKPQPHNLTASGSRTIVSKCSVFKVHPRFIQLGDNCPKKAYRGYPRVSVPTIQRGEATGCHPLSLGTIIHYYKGDRMSTLFFAIFRIFFAGIAGYSQLHRDSKQPLFRILMGLQAFLILTQGNYTPVRKRRQNAFILEMTSGSLRYYTMRPPVLLKVVFNTSSMLGFSQSTVGRSLSKNFWWVTQYTQSKSHPQKNFWSFLSFSLL